MIKVDKKIILLLMGRVIQTGLAVLSIRMLTGFLSQQEVGHQYLINSIILWFSLVLINPVGMYVNRHLHEWKEKKQLYFFIKQLNWYFALIAIFSVLVVFIVRKYFHVGEFLPYSEMIVFILVYIYFSTWFQTFVSLFNLFELQKVFVALNIFAQGCGLAFAVLGIKLFEANAITWMAGLLLGQISALVGAVFLFHKRFPKTSFEALAPPQDSVFSKATLIFCYPIAITTLFMWFMNQGYRLVIERNLGAEILASIGVGLGLAASLAGVVESLAAQYFYPGFYAALANSSLDQRKLAWEDLWKKTIGVYVPFCFLVLAVSSVVVRVLTAPTFHHVVPYLWFGAFIELFRQLSNVAYLVSHAEKKTHNTIIPYMIGGTVIAVGLALMISNNIIETSSILLLLVSAGFLTYAYNLVMVKRLINAKFDLSYLLKAIVLSLPLLTPIFFVSVDSNLTLLLSVSLLCGFWYLGCVYLVLKKSN